MKKSKDFRMRINASKYFNPHGTEAVMDVVRAHGSLFPKDQVYRHLRTHQSEGKAVVPTQVIDGKLVVDSRFKGTLEVVEGIPDNSTSNHELGLDDFIKKGRQQLAAGQLQITAGTFLNAIKIKADIEKGTKDRRMEALKAMFAGAAPKKQDDA